MLSDSSAKSKITTGNTMTKYNKKRNEKIHRQFLQDFDTAITMAQDPQVVILDEALLSNHNHN
jgi:ABC-type Na+ transport system ATPase subunit NatA